jgi:hypothetical protein
MLIRTSLIALALAAATGASAATFSTDINALNTQSVAIDTDAEVTDWRVVVDQAYLVPRGFSYSPLYDFGARPVAIDAVKVQLFVERGRACGAAVQAIDVAHDNTRSAMTRYTPDLNGEIVLAPGMLSKMMIHLYQPYYLTGSCIVRISVLPADGSNPRDPSDDFQLGGAMNYQGGFRNRIELPIDSTDKIGKFWLRIPSFCAGLEVLEAGTVTEGQYEAARLVDGDAQIYEVNGGAGTRISAIQVSINGPADASCEIPVYLSAIAD